jgi:hypothetical protein
MTTLSLLAAAADSVTPLAPASAEAVLIDTAVRLGAPDDVYESARLALGPCAEAMGDAAWHALAGACRELRRAA